MIMTVEELDESRKELEHLRETVKTYTASELQRPYVKLIFGQIDRLTDDIKAAELKFSKLPPL